MTKKRLLVVSGAVLVAAVGITASLIFTTRANPEDRLYAVLATEPKDQILIEEAKDEDGNTINFEGIIKKDGTIKVKGNAVCKASTGYGDTNLRMTFAQVQHEMFMTYDEISSANGEDPALDQEFNDFYKENLVGKTVQVETEDTDAESLKRYGILFSTEGIYSTKIDKQKIIAKLKEHKVYTIVSTSKASYKGDPTTEYTLTVRRSAYEKFIDSLVPGYAFKSDVLDTLFADDTEEIDININNKTGALVHAAYSMENLCGIFLSSFDDTAITELPSRMNIKSSAKAGSDVKVEKPATYMTMEEYSAIFAPEE